MKTWAVRLHPGQDLRQELTKFTQEQRLQSGFIVTAVGSLQEAHLRFANGNTAQIFIEKFELVALSGTLSLTGLHLHLVLANDRGQVMGGHLLEGCLIYTTAEIVIGTAENLLFKRIPDAMTGFSELMITPINSN